jgi:lysophospholipase L1-like esterase
MLQPVHPNPSPKPRFSSKVFLKNVLFSFIVSIFVLAVLDQAVGVYMRRDIMSSLQEPDRHLLWKLPPGAQVEFQMSKSFPAYWAKDPPGIRLVINEDGYRGAKVTLRRTENELRILCLGDSLTLGLYVNEDMTYPAQLQRFLQDRLLHRRVTVINGGVQGYSSRQGLYLFQTKFLAYQPDLVIWGYGANDPGVIPLPVANPDLELIPLIPNASFSPPLKARIFFWLFSRPLVQVVRLAIFPIIWQAQHADLNELAEKAKSLPAIVRSPSFYSRSRVPPKDFKLHLEEMRSLAKEHHFQLLVINFFGTPDLYRQTAKDFCASFQIPYFDFTGEFYRLSLLRKIPDDPASQEMFKLYEPALAPGALDRYPMLFLLMDNLHPNNLGHRFVANVLANFIARHAKDSESGL